MGDRIAFEKLYDRHSESVLFHIKRIVQDNQIAEDLLQEVYVRVWEKREEWASITSQKAWIIRIGINLALNYLRGKNRKKEHVFGIDPELIKQPHDLLLMLLSRHYGNQRVPITLDERLIQVLQSKEVFRDWPLREILPDRSSFFAFLQERWIPFLDGLVDPKAKVVREAACAYALEYAGPLDVPFEHDNVRIYVDNLFLEGLLKPVCHERAHGLPKTWISIGVKSDPVENRKRRLKGFMKKLEEELPQNDARHQDWSAFAFRWAELILLVSELSANTPSNMLEEFKNFQQLVDNSFRAWCEKNYAGLYNQPPVPPVMVHHIPKALARQMSELGQSKIALMVVDGLSIDQWLVLRDVLSDARPELRFRESAVYAWIPTMTSVSRQADWMLSAMGLMRNWSSTFRASSRFFWKSVKNSSTRLASSFLHSPQSISPLLHANSLSTSAVSSSSKRK